MSNTIEVTRRQTAADMATVLRSVLAPVLADELEHRAISELDAALNLARAGMSMSRYRPKWLLFLDGTCAKMQKQRCKVLHAQVQYNALNPRKTPKQLRVACEDILQLATEHKITAELAWVDWLNSKKGQACLIKLEEALLQGQKSKSFILADSQIDECLQSDEECFNKSTRQLLNRSRWRNIKALGKAAQRQRLSRTFVNLLGLQVDADDHLAEIEDYQSLLAARRTARWLNQQLDQVELSMKEAAAYGALWQQQMSEFQRLELGLLVRIGALPSSAPLLPDRQRPSLPLELQFASTTTASA